MTRRAFALTSIVLGLVLASCRSKGDAMGATDLDGRTVDPFAAREGPTVLFFVGAQCPISNRYVPEVARIHEKFSSRGVRFFAVYPSATESTEQVRAHAKEMAIPFVVLRDPGHALVTRAGVKVTPEVAVLRASGEVVYRGRVDDRVVDFGVMRPEPTKHDLADALESLLAGKPIPASEAPAVGCSIPK